MNVFVYQGLTFFEHKKCYVGWMSRNRPNSNEIYEPKTVIEKFNLNQKSKNSIPIVFDLKEREFIYTDISMKKNISNGNYSGNNVESNRAGIEDILYATVHQKKMNLYNLFEDHTMVRSNMLVDNKESADFTFGLEDCDITPEDWAAIQTDWMG